MKFIYNSWQVKHKNPFGAVRNGKEVTFFVDSDADRVFLLGFKDKVEMQKTDTGFFAIVTPDIDCGLIFYSFEVAWGNDIYIYGECEDGGQCELDGRQYQLTVHKNVDTPEWFKNKVMYQIYVDRFFKGDDNDVSIRENILMHTSWNDKPVYIRNEKGEIVIWDFFGGNLDGIIKKLDYIKSLGVDIIYLNPIFESSSNHKYDTADYSKIDRMYGNEEVLRRLVDEAHKRNMKIMLDGVFSHTGDDSIYFNKYKTYGEGGAYYDKQSKYHEWYSFENYPEKYESWWGITALPCVKELTPSFIDYLLNEENGAVIKWMRAGVAGWRLDVADELPDEFIKKLKDAIVKINPQAVLLGEVWEDASNKVSYDIQRKYILEDSMNSVSNYPLRDSLMELLLGRTTIKAFSSRIMRIQENYPKDIFMSLMNMTGTHDTTRLLTLLGDAPAPEELNTWKQREYTLPTDQKQLAQKRLKLFLVAIYTMPGNPCIYYGDEIGLEGYKDPYNRGTYDWNEQDDSIILLIKELSSLRVEMLSDETFMSFENQYDILVYRLVYNENTYRVYINHTDKVKELEISGKQILFTHASNESGGKLIIQPYGALITLD